MDIAATRTSPSDRRVFSTGTVYVRGVLLNASRGTVYRELQRRRVAFRAACEAHIF